MRKMCVDLIFCICCLFIWGCAHVDTHFKWIPNDSEILQIYFLDVVNESDNDVEDEDVDEKDDADYEKRYTLLFVIV